LESHARMKKKSVPGKPLSRKPFGSKPAGRFGDKPAGRFGDKPAGRFGDKPPGRFGDKPAGRFGDKPPARPFGDKPEGRFGDKPAGRFGDQPEGRFGDKPAGRYGDKPDGRFGDKPPGRFGDKPAGRFGDKPAGRFGDKPAGRFGDKPTGRFGDKPPARPFGRAAINDGQKPLGRPFRPSEGGDESFEPQTESRPPSRGNNFDGPAPRRPFNDKPPGARPFGNRPPSNNYDDERPTDRKPFTSRPMGKGPAGRSFPSRSRGPESRDFTEPLNRDIREDARTRGKAAGRRVELDFDDLIYGVHAVEEALRSGEEIVSLHVGTGRDRDSVVAELMDAARRLEVNVRLEPPEFFANIPYKAHQSVIAIGKPFGYVSLDEAMAIRQTNRLVVVMDHLTDPHNVGAILRTAECAGAQAAILPDRRSAGVNATVRKVAAGAASHLAIAKVGNLAQTLRSLKDNGFTVFGAALEDDSKDLSEVDFTGDVALVIGAEGEGLGRLVARGCDQLVKIPILGKTESLNASVAAGILLYEVVRQRDLGVS
jgi:23S rRNA (guanosine2251-2'-O)-methyltransferase